MSTYAGFSTSCPDSISGRDSDCTSEIAAELRPPRTCDLRTTVEVVAARLTSPERVTTGVGASSWAADSEIDSLGSDLVWTVSMVFSELSNLIGVT